MHRQSRQASRLSDSSIFDPVEPLSASTASNGHAARVAASTAANRGASPRHGAVKERQRHGILISEDARGNDLQPSLPRWTLAGRSIRMAVVRTSSGGGWILEPHDIRRRANPGRTSGVRQSEMKSKSQTNKREGFCVRHEMQSGSFDRGCRVSVCGVAVGAISTGTIFGKGQRFAGNAPRAVDLLIGGWQFNTITTTQTGNPLIVRGANNFALNRKDPTRAGRA
jgi:hypothetical protein